MISSTTVRPARIGGLQTTLSKTMPETGSYVGPTLTSAFAIPLAGTFGSASRNLIIGPGSRLLNAQFARDVRMGGNRALTIQVNTTNLLNMVNYAAIDTVVNSPTFGQVLSVRGMRSTQLNLRFRF